MFAKYVQFDRRRPITFRLFRDALDNYMLRRDQLVSSISTFDDLTQVPIVHPWFCIRLMVAGH